jgi:hypothetical protein
LALFLVQQVTIVREAKKKKILPQPLQRRGATEVDYIRVFYFGKSPPFGGDLEGDYAKRIIYLFLSTDIAAPPTEES